MQQPTPPFASAFAQQPSLLYASYTFVIALRSNRTVDFVRNIKCISYQNACWFRWRTAANRQTTTGKDGEQQQRHRLRHFFTTK